MSRFSSTNWRSHGQASISFSWATVTVRPFSSPPVVINRTPSCARALTTASTASCVVPDGTNSLKTAVRRVSALPCPTSISFEKTPRANCFCSFENFSNTLFACRSNAFSIPPRCRYSGNVKSIGLPLADFSASNRSRRAKLISGSAPGSPFMSAMIRETSAGSISAPTSSDGKVIALAKSGGSIAPTSWNCWLIRARKSG